MMLDNASQADRLTFVVDELAEMQYHNVQLTTSMHRENGGQAACTNRDNVHHSDRDALHDEHDLVDWTDAGIHDHIERRTR